MNKYLSLLAVLLLISSCTVGFDDDITVTRNRSGRLNIWVEDSDGNPLVNSKISIFESKYQLYQGVSDASGYYDVKKLLEGEYTYTVLAKKGKVDYVYRGSMTIGANENIDLRVNPLKNSGIFEVLVLDEKGKPIEESEDFSIALLPFPSNNISTIEALLESAHFIADLDKNARAIIKDIPSGKGYVFYLLGNRSKVFSKFLTYNVMEGETREIVLRKYY